MAVALEVGELAQAEASAVAEPVEATASTGSATVAHVVDFHHRYPGETVTFFTQVQILGPLADLVLRVTLPLQLRLGDYHPPAERPVAMPHLETDDEGQYLVWPLAGQLSAGSKFEYRAEATILPSYWPLDIESRAVLSTPNHVHLAEEITAFKVWPKGRYLRFLPELYEQDDLMGRFLMLFESFWSPIETQIGAIPYYLDPRITPAPFLPWLSSWLDLRLDETWPTERLRLLIRWAIALHRSRGTKWGLLKYLEIYTGQPAKISERRSKDFILGTEAKLGPGVAFGRGNQPHTFTVSLRLPPLAVNSDAESERLEQLRRKTIESIINMQKPAHTVYTLDLQIVSSGQVESEAEEKAATAAPSFHPPVNGTPLSSPRERGERGVASVKVEVDAIAAQAAVWFKLD